MSVLFAENDLDDIINLRCDNDGALKVNVISGGGGVSSDVNVQNFPETQTVDGSVNIGTMPATQATYNATPPTVVDGNNENLQCDENGNLKTSDSKITQLQNQQNSTTNPLQSVKILGYKSSSGAAQSLKLDSNDNLNVNVNNSSAISVNTGLNSVTLVSASSDTISSDVQGVRLLARKDTDTTAHYPLKLDANDNLLTKDVNITTCDTDNISGSVSVSNFNTNRIGVYNTTPPTLSDNDESKIRMSENAEPIIRQRCNGVVLPESKDNWNVQVPISCSGSYIATPNIPYRYNNANSDFVLDVGHPAHLLRDFRRNNNVYSYNATFNYTNTSNNENLLFFQNSDTDTDIYLYSVSLEAQSPTNPANGEYMFVLLNVMTGLDVSGNLPQTNGTSRESTFSLQSLNQGDGNNKKSGDTTATGTDRGQLMTIFIGQGARNHQELDLLNSLLRIGPNNGLRLRVEGNMQANINYNLTIRYIRTAIDL